MKQLSTRTITIIISLIALALLALGVFVTQKDKEVPLPLPIPENPENSENQMGPEETITETIDISEWKTYRNEEYGFEVKYPQNWTLRSDDETKVSLNSPENERYLEEVQKGNGGAYSHDIIISYYDSIADEPENKDNNLDAKTLDEFVERNPFVKLVERVSLSGEEAVSVERYGYGEYFSVLSIHDGRLYEIFFGNFNSEINLSEEEKNILNSFSFLGK